MMLIGNGTVVTRDTGNNIIENGCIAIIDELIVEVGDTTELRNKYRNAKFIDAQKKLIMPGIINTHTHFYSAFARGMLLSGEAPKNFTEILSKLWWRLDKALGMEDVYYSAMVSIIESIKNGTTTVFDHHASPHALTGSLFKIHEATKKAGIRACLSYEVSDRDGEEIANAGIDENINFINYCNKEQDDMIKGIFGLHASFTLSDKTLKRCVERNVDTGVGFHIHCAEGIADYKNARDNYDMGVIDRLESREILGEKTIAAHCIHISDIEIDILKRKNNIIVHNPQSNMSNAVGVSPILKMHDKGIALGLGTDGYTSDMFESYKATVSLHKHANQDPRVAWTEPGNMLFENNPKIGGRFFVKPVGRLVSGALADIIVVDYNPPTNMNSANLNSHLLFGVSGRMVDTSIINGKIVMENRKLTMIDEEEVFAKSRELSTKLWERI